MNEKQIAIHILILSNSADISRSLKQNLDEDDGRYEIEINTPKKLQNNEFSLTKFSLLIFDTVFKNGEGFRVVKGVKAVYPKLKVLILGNYAKGEFVNEFIEAGASGVLPINSSQKEIRKEVISILF